MTLTDLVDPLRRRWVTAGAVLAACVVSAVAFAVTAPTTYSATTTMYVSMATGTSVNDSFQGGMAAQQRVTTYSHIAGGSAVAERVIDELGLDTSPGALRSRVSVTFPPATTLLQISVTDPAPQGAQRLADAFAAQFQELVGQMETTVVGAAPAAQVNVLEAAELPTSPIGWSATKIVALGLVLGVALGILAAFARDRLDRRLRRPEQFGEALSAPPVAVSPREPDSSRDYARLRRAVTNRPGPGSPTQVLVTSISGRSHPEVSLRLAQSLHAAGAKTVLVDADTSAGGPTTVLRLQGQPGVADWLGSRTSRLDAVLRQTDDGCPIVPLGAVDLQTAQLLDSERFWGLLADLGAQYDHIVVATIPGPADAATPTASSANTGIVAVGELGTDTLRAARDAAEAFAAAGVPVVAAVALAPAGRANGRPEPAKPAHAVAR